MKICVIGTGYVGLVTGACLADVGNHVWCIDKDAAKIASLQENKIPIYEPGLETIVQRNIHEGRLFFSTSLQEGLALAEVCFISVDTPPDGDGKADLTNVLAVAKQLGEIIESVKIVVTKSTVPVGTTHKVKTVISDELKKRGLSTDLIQVANNPEFLKEGSAVQDAMKPERVIVGVESDEVGKKLHQLYTPFMHQQDRFLQMDIPSSEMCKYAANAMLATRISFMNELSRLAEKVGADITEIRRGLGRDSRIGPAFLYAGLGYGGSCFPKDMKALVQLGKEYNTPLSIMESADLANDMQREWFWNKITTQFGGAEKLAGKRIALWGVAFKPETDDVRFAPSLYLIENLLAQGASVLAYDPVAQDTGRQALGDKAEQVNWADNSYDCLAGADALIVCTEWREFRSPDFIRIKKAMNAPLIFDGRLLYEPATLQELGFDYVTIGR